MRVDEPSARAGRCREPELGFGYALGRAEARRPAERPIATSTRTRTPASTETPAAAPAPALAVAPAALFRAGVEEGGASASSTPVAARAIAALAVLRHAERAQVEIAAGEELRYRLSQTALGVEIRARVAPDLERVARVHLLAVADALRQRGVRLARAQVHLAPGSRDRVGR